MAKASSTLSIGLTNRVNATTIAIDATKSFLLFVLVLVVNICFIHSFDTVEKIYWDC